MILIGKLTKTMSYPKEKMAAYFWGIQIRIPSITLVYTTLWLSLGTRTITCIANCKCSILCCR